MAATAQDAAITIIAGWQPSASAWVMLCPGGPISTGTGAMTKTDRHDKPGITTHRAARATPAHPMAAPPQ